MTILNLTQHSATAEQKSDRCVDMSEPSHIHSLLNFNEFPDSDEIIQRAQDIAELADEQWKTIEKDDDGKCAMIGGAPFFMKPLHEALEAKGFEVCYAFSTRESVERTANDGSIIKTNVFKHRGYVFL